LVDGDAHVREPAVARLERHRERGVADAQARVPALLAVRAGAAPILLEEAGETLDGALEILLRVHGPQELVGAHTLVEAAHELLERRTTPDLLPEARADDVAALAHSQLEVHPASPDGLGARVPRGGFLAGACTGSCCV